MAKNTIKLIKAGQKINVNPEDVATYKANGWEIISNQPAAPAVTPAPLEDATPDETEPARQGRGRPRKA